jgi:hypothetical protein
VVSRHINDLDAVLKSDSLDDFRQLVFSLQSPPGFRGRGDELERHQLGGRRRQGPLRPHRPMTDLVSVLGREVEEESQSAEEEMVRNPPCLHVGAARRDNRRKSRCSVHRRLQSAGLDLFAANAGSPTRAC